MTLDRRRLDELWTRHLAGAPLSEDDRRALIEAALADGERAAELAADARVHHALASLAASAGDEDAFVAAVARRMAAARAPSRRLRFALALAVPLAAAAALLLLLIGRPGPRPALRAQAPAPLARESGRPGETAPAGAAPTTAVATLASARGDVFVFHRGARARAGVGSPLAEGDTVVTVGATSGATVALAGRGHVEVGPDAVVAPLAGADEAGAASVFVASGDARLIADGRRPLRVHTPQAESVVSAPAAFAVHVADGRTRVDVAAGAVRFRAMADGQTVEVAAGQQALTARPSDGERAPAVSGGKRRALLVIGSVPPDGPADRAVLERLRQLGFDVVASAASSGGLDEEARASALVAVSSTVDSATLGGAFRDLPVPLVVWEPALYDDLGMTGPPDPDVLGALPGGELVIVDPGHPLAAGLSGRVRVADRRGNQYLSQGTPAPTANWIATMPGDPVRATIFAYEKGMPMVGLAAPARRVGLFVSDLIPPHMTRDGWALFDAAVRWAASGL